MGHKLSMFTKHLKTIMRQTDTLGLPFNHFLNDEVEQVEEFEEELEEVAA